MFNGLYAITDSHLTPANLIEQKVELALRGGARIIQYREKPSSCQQRKTIALKLLDLVNQYHSKLIINDDLELAHEIKAHGVHLGQNDRSLSEARKLLGSEAIVGATCHNSLDMAEKAIKQGASYVAFGRFYTSKTKPDASVCSVEFLKEARQTINLPIVAIGGISLDNAQPLIEAGADMIAVVNGIFGTEDVEKQSIALSRLFK